MNKEIVLADFNQTFNELEQLINAFSYDTFNQVPFEGSWTPGQVVQHIILASSGFVQVLNGEVATTERAIDELVPRIKADFLNFEIKFNSPDFILPESKDYDKDRQLAKVNHIKHEIADSIPALELDKTCLTFELPGYGKLTQLEAIYFVIYHTQRHIHQLKKILLVLS